MEQLLPILERDTAAPLYEQLYAYLKDAVRRGDLRDNDKLPSLRHLATALSVSITTVQQAYTQLAVEGYIESRPQSGYYVTAAGRRTIQKKADEKDSPGIVPAADAPPENRGGATVFSAKETAWAKYSGSVSVSFPKRQADSYRSDPECFDFTKWKKCYCSVLNDMPEQLLFESDPRGEEALRYEISRYVFASRGVRCDKGRVVIAAGTQQITSLICTLLRRLDITNVSMESPGYAPVRHIFRDRGFRISHIPVTGEGIRVEKLPINLPSAAYVNPSNQFPTGAVMPVARRQELLNWAANNDSYVIEDDYDSELRYFGKPIPALQGLDQHDRVIYLGSFSSTLFPSAKISYMVLPERLAGLFREIAGDYSQGCSKAEQLALALFMERGYYRKGINRLRRMYAAKLHAAIGVLQSHPGIEVRNAWSGISLLLQVKLANAATSEPQSSRDNLTAAFCEAAGKVGVEVIPVTAASDPDGILLNLYYTRIPLSDMKEALEQILQNWQALSAMRG